MDETAEHIAALHLLGLGAHRGLVSPVGNRQRQATVRTLAMVVTDIGTQQPYQMLPAKHQRPVKTLRP